MRTPEQDHCFEWISTAVGSDYAITAPVYYTYTRSLCGQVAPPSSDRRTVIPVPVARVQPHQQRGSREGHEGDAEGEHEDEQGHEHVHEHGHRQHGHRYGHADARLGARTRDYSSGRRHNASSAHALPPPRSPPRIHAPPPNIRYSPDTAPTTTHHAHPSRSRRLTCALDGVREEELRREGGGGDERALAAVPLQWLGIPTARRATLTT